MRNNPQTDEKTRVEAFGAIRRAAAVARCLRGSGFPSYAVGIEEAIRAALMADSVDECARLAIDEAHDADFDLRAALGSEAS